MSLFPASCSGCTYSGYPHNEDCPEASCNKYGLTCSRNHIGWKEVPDIPWGLVEIEDLKPLIDAEKLPQPDIEVLGMDEHGIVIWPVRLCDVNPYLRMNYKTGKYRWSHKNDHLKLKYWMAIPEVEKDINIKEHSDRVTHQ